jgi:GntR family transcriptional regulator
MADPLLESWHVEYHSGIPVYRQIINQIGTAMADGTLKTGDQLPTIRALSGHLQVNPNTVAKAYRELELKGTIASERGSGSFVQSQPAAVSGREKKASLKKIYQRLLAEAAGNGVSEAELLTFIKERNPSIP